MTKAQIRRRSTAASVRGAAPKRRGRALALAAAGLLAGSIGSIQLSTAAFTAQTANPGNSFATSSYFGFFASGFYSGNGADDRAITGIGFQPDVVIIKGNTFQTPTIRTSTMSGDAAKPMIGATAQTADLIQSLEPGGFTIGTDPRVNSSSVDYEWMAFRAQDGLLKVGSYAGNGTSQSISGLGFSPEHAAVFSAGADNAVQRFSGASTSYQFDADAGNAQRITSLDAAGFSVGTQNTVNANSTTYHWIAFNDSTGGVDISGYTGTGTDNRNITGVGFQPEYVIVRADDTVTARFGAHRPASLPGDSSLRFSAFPNLPNSLQALQSDGFQVGTDGSVNANSVAYRYLAVRDTPDSTGGGCAGSGSQLVAPTADATIDQGLPTSNLGTSSDLYVRSASANKRTLVRFNLPSIPAGCSLTGASLKLHSTSAAGGRTIEVYRAAATPTWTEGGVSWNNAPATAGTATDLASTSGPRRWDVAAQVQAMYSGTNNGFVVRDQTENSGAAAEQKYQAREGTPDTQDPELRVSWG